MAIKSEVTGDSGNGTDFPSLMKSDREIVLFTEWGIGFVVKSFSMSGRPVGCHGSMWVMGHFAPFNGTLELSNE